MLGTISIRTVEALSPGATLWDTAVRGFGVRRQQDSASYIVKYRAGGRQRFLTIGPHGRLTPDQARREAKRLLGLVASGNDPADEKAQATLRAADTLGKIAGEYLKYAKQNQRPRTYCETERYLLKSFKCDQALEINPPRRGNPKSGMVMCALVVCEVWASIHSRPPGHNNETAQDLCEEYWIACRQSEGTAGRWEHHISQARRVRKAQRYRWISQKVARFLAEGK
jgi:hypothetical protein